MAAIAAAGIADSFMGPPYEGGSRRPEMRAGHAITSSGCADARLFAGARGATPCPVSAMVFSGWPGSGPPLVIAAPMLRPGAVYCNIRILFLAESMNPRRPA